MKPESEIGVALRAGHPVYFIGFLPKPEPGQTIEDVCGWRHIGHRCDRGLPLFRFAAGPGGARRRRFNGFRYVLTQAHEGGERGAWVAALAAGAHSRQDLPGPQPNSPGIGETPEEQRHWVRLSLAADGRPIVIIRHSRCFQVWMYAYETESSAVQRLFGL
jgi:uncharacterized protein DUF3141